MKAKMTLTILVVVGAASYSLSSSQLLDVSALTSRVLTASGRGGCSQGRFHFQNLKGLESSVRLEETSSLSRPMASNLILPFSKDLQVSASSNICARSPLTVGVRCRRRLA